MPAHAVRMKLLPPLPACAAAATGTFLLSVQIQAVRSETKHASIHELLLLRLATLWGVQRWRSALTGPLCPPVQEVTFQPDILYLVGRGFLAPPAGYRILTEADLSEVKSTKTGDFRESEVGAQLAGTQVQL